jgi:hypothetical protein
MGIDGGNTDAFFIAKAVDTNDRLVITQTGFVGIGIENPRQLLHVNQTTATSDAIVRITNSNTPSTGTHRVEFADGTGTTEGSTVFRYGYIAGERSSGANDGHLVFGTKEGNSTSPVEQARIDSSGNLLVGTTDTTLFNNTTGGGFKTGGDLRTDMARQADVVCVMNRTGTSNGQILQFRADGAHKGDIGIDDGTYIYIESQSGTGLDFRGDILPRYNGSLDSSAQVDIGSASYKFRDGQFNGTLYAARGVGETDIKNGSGNHTPDFTSYQNFYWTLTTNCLLLNSTGSLAPEVGQSGFFAFKQDGTGGRTMSLSSYYKTPGGAGLTLSSAAGAIDFIPYTVISSTEILLGTPQLAFA